MKRTYHGSCHCGAIRYEADLDLSVGTRRCNCSFCRKTRMWKAFAPHGDFRLLVGEDVLSDYRALESQWPEGHVHHNFCSRCGVRPFTRFFLEMAPFNGWCHAVNIATLDDVTDDQFAAATIVYEDGRNNDTNSRPAVTSYL